MEHDSRLEAAPKGAGPFCLDDVSEDRHLHGKHKHPLTDQNTLRTATPCNSASTTADALRPACDVIAGYTACARVCR